jgi:hypothetical protein
MLKTIASLQGVSILSREAQKRISGGGACTITWHDSSGWHTEEGTCSHVTMVVGHYGVPFTGEVSYCHSKHHTAPTELSSNGGKSRC